MTTEAERIGASGVEVVLAGKTIRIVFDFAALEMVEEEFGGLYEFTQVLNGGWRTRRLKALRVSLVAGQSWRESAGEPVRPTRAIRTAEVVLLLGKLTGSPEFFSEVEAAIRAIGAAVDQAMPPAPSSRAARESKSSARVRRSRGRASSAGPSSSSGSRQETSAV